MPPSDASAPGSIGKKPWSGALWHDEDNVLSLKVVLANGELMTTARRAKKSSAGYDLTRLIVGSEGTLGVITELTLRVVWHPRGDRGGRVPIPERRGLLRGHDPDIQSAFRRAHRAPRCAAGAGLQRYSKLALRRRRCCSSNSTAAMRRGRASQRFGEIAAELGGGPFDWATRPEDRSKLWQARHDALLGGPLAARGRRCRRHDVCVPISRLAQCGRDPARHRRQSVGRADRGHVGDGNFHLTLMVTLPMRRGCSCQGTQRAPGGTGAGDGWDLTGEHGVGQGKMAYLPAEHGEAALDAMRAIKRAFDPDGIMNPGKIVAL